MRAKWSEQMNELQDLVDREKIRELFYRYALGCDNTDADAVLSVFDDPCTLIIYPRDCGNPEIYPDRAAVEKFFRFDLVPFNDTRIVRHRISNQIVDLDGNSARARVYCDEVREVKNPSSHLISGGGVYLDNLRRVGQGWKISERGVYSTYWLTLFKDLEQAISSGQALLRPRIKGLWGAVPQ
jgi:hypothetical protein